MKRALKRILIMYHIVDGRRVEGPPAGVTGDLSGVRGNLSGITGDLTGVWGDLTGVWGDLDECGLTAGDRAKGIYISELIEGGGA